MKKEINTNPDIRQYILTEDFSLYYYNDLNFSGAAPHTHDYYEIHFFLEGDITVYMDGLPLKLKPGDIVFVPCGLSHYVTCEDPAIPYRRFVLGISQAYARPVSYTHLEGYKRQAMMAIKIRTKISMWPPPYLAK